MQFKKDVNVKDSAGKRVGEVDRVVIDPENGEVSHLILRTRGLFGADKVLPIDLIRQTSDEEVILNVQADEVKSLPDFVEIHYVPLDAHESADKGYGPDSAVPVLWYPAPGAAMFTYPGTYPAPSVYPYKLDEKVNTPKGTVALQEGAHVMGKDGKHVGDVEKVFTEDQQDRVTHLLITKGAFNHEKKLIPAAWISAIKPDGVRLSVNAEFIDKLRDFKE